MKSIEIWSPAKINLVLKILGRRSDGYHEIRTVFQSIDLADRIRLRTRPQDGISIDAVGHPVPCDSGNLIWKAAEAIRPFARRSAGVHVELDKRVPVGAGLGGGSSNATMTLLALNRLWDCGLSRDDLNGLAAGLGSDTVFFLYGGTAVASGRGETLTPLPDADWDRRFEESGIDPRLMLVDPGFPISAREAYGLGEWGVWPDPERLTSSEAANTIRRFRLADRPAVGDREAICDLLENDFEDSLYKHFPNLAQVRRILDRNGCRKSLISGSGSTVIGLFDRGVWTRAAHRVAEQGAGEVLKARFVSRSDYRERLDRALSPRT